MQVIKWWMQWTRRKCENVTEKWLIILGIIAFGGILWFSDVGNSLSPLYLISNIQNYSYYFKKLLKSVFFFFILVWEIWQSQTSKRLGHTRSIGWKWNWLFRSLKVMKSLNTKLIFWKFEKLKTLQFWESGECFFESDCLFEDLTSLRTQHFNVGKSGIG